MPKKIQIEVIHEATSCIKSTICQLLGVISEDDIEQARNHPFEFGSISVLAELANAQRESRPTSFESKISVNDIKALISAYNNTQSDYNGVDEKGIQVSE